MIELPRPYLLFLGDNSTAGFDKTARGLKDWAPEQCIGEYALSGSTVTVGLKKLSPRQAVERGARGLVIGVAAPGGKIRDAWIPALIEALQAGLDIVSGMHSRLAHTTGLSAAAKASGRRFVEVRRPPGDIPVGTGRKRSGRRLLTVGTDCALGKKYTALALARAFRSRGIDADFRATGQTGIMIAGRGMPIDAVVSDFVAGAAEILSPANKSDHWDVIEGQGSLFHPSFAGVSLGLLHGSQPDVIIVCHEPGRREVVGCPGYGLPSLEATIDLNLRLGARTNPSIRCAGVSLNTSALPESAAFEVLAQAEQSLGLPAADPIRGGPAFSRLVESCLA
jgi:uncharacterized NAD-dependent epimerase/dehydratase family protein